METQICVTGSLTRLIFFPETPRRLAAKRRAAAVEVTGQGNEEASRAENHSTAATEESRTPS